MIEHSVIAACFVAACTWLLFSPVSSARRLSRVHVPQRSTRDQGTVRRLLESAAAYGRALPERGRSRQRWRRAVIELCDGMASELTAGRTPDEAFAITAALLDPRIGAELLNRPPSPTEIPVAPPCREGRLPTENGARPETVAQIPLPAMPSVTCLFTGAAPTTRLEELGLRPGAEGLRLLAACWRIGAERGGALATVLDGLATALRDEEAQRQEIATQLAGPRATARLLSTLPLVGLGMAAALGADPLTFLFGTPLGNGCLVTGTMLNLLGFYWTKRLAQKAEDIR